MKKSSFTYTLELRHGTIGGELNSLAVGIKLALETWEKQGVDVANADPKSCIGNLKEILKAAEDAIHGRANPRVKVVAGSFREDDEPVVVGRLHSSAEVSKLNP